MRNVISRIQAHKIQQRKRPHGISAAQLHRIINILNRPNTLFVRANRIQQIRHQQPVYDESRLVRRTHRNLAQLFPKLVSRLINIVGSSNRPHHFDQLHQRHGIKKVQPNKPLRTLYRSQQLRHRNRRSVRCKNRILLHDPVNRGIHLLLLFHILDDGLNHNVAIGQVRLVGRAFEPRADRIFLLRRNPALLHRPLGKLRQRFLNPGKPFVEKLLLNLKHSHIKPSRSANLRNARPHQSTAKNTNLLDFHSKIPLPRICADFLRIKIISPWRHRGTENKSFL